MIKTMLSTAAVLLTFTLMAAAQEDVKTRLDNKEILDAIATTEQMPAAQQDAKIEGLWKDPSATKTPRTDFLFCTGLAYRGDYRAQRCVGYAYENGIGIVEDLSEAYAWYTVALENPKTAEAAKPLIEGDKGRVQAALTSGYPSPTEDELEDLVRSLKNRIAELQK